MNTSAPPRPRLQQALAGVEAGAAWWAALVETAARLPADPGQARALAVFETLRPLRADPEVLAAACLHQWPALREALSLNPNTLSAYILQVQSAAWYVKLTDRLFGPAPAKTAKAG